MLRFNQYQVAQWLIRGHLLFPASTLNSGKLLLSHSVSSSKVTSKTSALSQDIESGMWDNSPAVILASISTLESAGIQDSGSSTRSWIGILRCGQQICANLAMVPQNLPLANDRVVLHTFDNVNKMYLVDPVTGDLLAHTQHPINLLDTEPVQNVRHQCLKSHVFDTCNVFCTLEVLRGTVQSTLSGIVDKILCQRISMIVPLLFSQEKKVMGLVRFRQGVGEWDESLDS
jgi:hypothetical protein